VVAHPARPCPALVPDLRHPAFLADPGLIREPQLDPFGLRVTRGNIVHQPWQAF
jgi:hypothetical protein